MINFKIKITDIINNGFIGTSPNTKKVFRLQDKSLNGHKFKVNQVLDISIVDISKEEIGNDINGKKFYCVVNEFTNNGFYTKTFDENESIFKRAWRFDERGMFTFPKGFEDEIEYGDILKVEIK